MVTASASASSPASPRSPSVTDICLAARAASRVLATMSTAVKDASLLRVADALEERAPEILEANARDLEAGRENGLSDALMDRLALDPKRLAGIADAVRSIAAIRSASSARRSISAAESPDSRPASRSRALASRISGVRACSADAIASSAASLTAELVAASPREAALAARQMSVTEVGEEIAAMGEV